ncbi:hypothetical protein E2P81_ATG07606 [Venturia nashicola]|nr:hypothetical protein E2P81_ATG07606 [Venturia nashicola]
MKMDKFFRPSTRSRIKKTYHRYCPFFFKMNPHWLPRTPASKLRTPLSPRPETPLSFAESFVTDDHILHKCRVAPLCDWIYTYHNYGHTGDARAWSLLALKEAVTFLTYAVHTMSRDMIDVQAALDENRHESEDEDKHQSPLDEDVVSSKDDSHAALIQEQVEETEEQKYERERKSLHLRQLVHLQRSVGLLLTSYEKDEAAVMIEDRIRECQRVLIVILGADANGECL